MKHNNETHVLRGLAPDAARPLVVACLVLILLLVACGGATQAPVALATPVSTVPQVVEPTAEVPPPAVVTAAPPSPTPQPPANGGVARRAAGAQAGASNCVTASPSTA